MFPQRALSQPLGQEYTPLANRRAVILQQLFDYSSVCRIPDFLERKFFMQ
jgi:hypothetical protein